MSKNVIEINKLGKSYIIGHKDQGARYTALRDVVSESFGKLWSRIRHPEYHTHENVQEFWALKDIDLEVKQGERLGIIGRNGAGKTTLLKVLSRITEPTTGQIRVKGRVASLLEIGTGFHPELTGRENVYLNGAVLGMTRAEIKRKFDEIVDFAGIEQFLDTPVKRYSSGMLVRLGFSVAAHLEPEILVVDEVLAVGDAAFQKKCLGKMDEVSREGRTILFVSHNMQAVKFLCHKFIHLRNSTIVESGDDEAIITRYLNYSQNLNTNAIAEKIKNVSDNDTLKLLDIILSQNNIEVIDIIENGNDFEISIKYKVLKKVSGLRVYVDIVDEYDTLIFRSFHDEKNIGISVMGVGIYISKVTINKNILGPISYIIKISATIYNLKNLFTIAMPIKVEKSGEYNKAYVGDTFRGKLGIVLPWEIKKIE